MKLIAINASPSDTSKTHAVAAAAVELAGDADGTVLDIGSLDADALLLRGEHPTVSDAIAAIAAADVLVLVTPIYRATYSGLLKVLLDQLPAGALAGKSCVLAATAGGPTHFLSLDTGMRALVASLDGWSVPTVVYATGADFDETNHPGPTVLEPLGRAIAEACSVVGGGLMAFDESGEAIAHVREICLALPDAVERLSHGSPTFFIGGKKTFVMFLDDHHDDGRLALWCAAEPGVQATLVDEEPDRFFVPPYVGHRGWIGVRLDREVDWEEIAGVAEDAYRAVAPKRLLTVLDEQQRPVAPGDDADS